MNNEPQIAAADRARRRERLEHSVQQLSDAQVQADEDEFRLGLAALREFSHNHGHTRVPDGQLDPSGFPLATWVAGQRVAHLEDRLPPARRSALERIPGWQWEPATQR
ncbi:helicase [Frankia sp. R43]|uniref:helicase associated domain-containing protein n=1 Tax=Frankia sp. R43 TaxID=269536 RepID=UPI0006CA3863|nr:helicase associated domain-containing protein [Frankia sp. R43]KPM54054.1 helicase [Frankia sp. R43]